MEREQSYKDAAEHYEKAWKHESQQSAQVRKPGMLDLGYPSIFWEATYPECYVYH